MKGLILSWWLLCGADAATTHTILATGGQEALLPTQNPYVIDGFVAMQMIGGAFVLREMHKTHPKLATGIGIGMIAFRAFAVGNNAQQIAMHFR